MEKTVWKDLIYRSDLSDDELRLIPVTANENILVIFNYCVEELKIKKDSLLEGLSETEEDFFNRKKWISSFDSFRFSKNIFESSDMFLHHKDFFNAAGMYNKSKKSIHLLLVRVLSLHFILNNCVKFVRLFNNTFYPEVIRLGKNWYYVVFNYFPYTKEIMLGYECRFADGTGRVFMDMMNVESYSTKHLICDKKIERIVKYIYGKYKWDYLDNGKYIFINGQKIARHVRLKRLSIDNQQVFTDEIDENAESCNAVEITDNFYFEDHCIFEKGEIYNAPYCVIELEWEEIPFHRRIYNFFSKRFRLRYVTILELEKQIEFTNNQLFELQRVSEALRRERNSLEEKVIERTHELEEANEKLLELDRLKTEFYTNITHELRTPLTLIKSQVEAIQKRYFGDAISASSEIINSIKNNAENLNRLINNLLDFARIESGRMKLTKAYTDMSQYLKIILANIESAAHLKNIECIFLDKTGGLYINVDCKIFEKAIYNLLSNAVKFTPSGGKISLELEESEKEIFITVKDTGIGIEEDQHDVIFERFHQVDSSSTRKYEGTGIGLSLTKEIVLMHGGEIKLKSSPGEGSAFTIILQKNDRENEYENILKPATSSKLDDFAEVPEIQQNEVISENKSVPLLFSVLIAEDNEDLCCFLVNLLEAEFNVFSAHNGKETLDILNNSEIDIVISDIMMPEMDGIELLKKIRFDESFYWMPVIMLTARADFPMKLRGIEYGASDYIVKPFRPDELLARVRNQCRNVILHRNYMAKLDKDKNEKSLTSDTIIAVEEIKKYLVEYFRDDISREGLAATVNMSADHLSRMFKKHTGMRIIDYVNELRVESTLDELAAGEKKIINIAFDAGFKNLRSYNRVFKNLKGVTPGEYREGEKCLDCDFLDGDD